ncbi:unnamed protein product [Psylliodes chrysocephalus]|uniref:Uncharacterized protein n=1 Tax=Psylliodes chrysocephalus TaxID=3402493 RepID=A0A9P0GD97_9CUCU|nr:unnamed protein product [Psylliodes chrysocephala]
MEGFFVTIGPFQRYIDAGNLDKSWKQRNERFTAIHELKMDSSMAKCLPTFHPLTDYDTTSQFAGIGKKTCWKVFLSHHNLLSYVSINDNLEEDFNKMVNLERPSVQEKNNLTRICGKKVEQTWTRHNWVDDME